MSTKSLFTVALLLATTAPALADDPIYVVRPPIIQLRANVLPADAFAAPSTPTQPSTPPASDGYVFKSSDFDNSAGNNNVPIGEATVSLNGIWNNTALPTVGFCNIADAAPADSRKKSDVMFVPDMKWSSKQERYIQPYVVGKMAVMFYCDGVNNLPANDPNQLYIGKVILTVSP
ncbi:hypothetical protein HFN89_03800 [Rhizobium laguerreae]|nr:hypothetical protein [Rhizobium laguerreae]